jgi:hypothetical protein
VRAPASPHSSSLELRGVMRPFFFLGITTCYLQNVAATCGRPAFHNRPRGCLIDGQSRITEPRIFNKNGLFKHFFGLAPLLLKLARNG